MTIMAGRIAINGFGRIGRCVVRAWLRAGRGLELAVVNSRADIAVAAHLLKYDSTHGTLDGDVCARGDNIIADGKSIRYTRESDIGKLHWRDIDIVLECTGAHNDREKAARHLQAGAKKVLVAAPSKGADATIVYGINNADAAGKDIVSAASCTTNCLAPLALALHNAFGIQSGLMTTIHSYTSDQRLLDDSHTDLRRARAAAGNIIPTKTGAAELLGKVIPALNGKVSGFALRVPTPNVSLVDFTAMLGKDAGKQAINDALTNAANAMPGGVMTVSDLPLVSGDFNHNPASCIADLSQTRVIGGRLAKTLAWYDNEWGFSQRMLDIAALMAAD